MTPYTILQGDVMDMLATLPDESVNCVVTSPPYWGLRDYGVAGQIGLERTPEEYVSRMVAVFRDVRRVLRKDGVCWVNLGDSYVGASSTGAGSGWSYGSIRHYTDTARSSLIERTAKGLKPKDLVGIPWRVAFALQDDGWWLRQDVIWAKPNPMPESVTDRCTKAHEYVFLLTKAARYWWDAEAVREPFADERMGNPSARGGGKCYLAASGRNDAGYIGNGELTKGEERGGRNLRSVWTIPTQPTPDAHFATFPEELPRRCILASCPVGGVVLDPFAGSGTTLKVAVELGRRGLGIELNPKYIEIARRKLAGVQLPMVRTA